MVTYEMITGRLPFESRDYETLFNLILTKEVEYPSNMSDAARVCGMAEWRPGGRGWRCVGLRAECCSQPCQTLIAGLLDKEPNTRLGGGPNDGRDVQVRALI